MRQHSRNPGFQHQGHSDGDRRRVWRQNPGVPGARGRFAFQEDRAAGQGNHEPHRGVRGNGSHVGYLHAGENGSIQGRTHHGGGGVPGLRSRRFPRFARQPRHAVYVELLRHHQRADRWVRRGAEQAQDGRLQSARLTRFRFCCGDGDRRDMREAGHGPIGLPVA